MRTVAFAIAMTALSFGTAHAADANDAVDDVFGWGGLYIGAGIGYANFDANDRTFGGGNPNPNGVLFTGFVGYNWQIDNVVFGVEADISGGSVDGSNASGGGFLQPLDMEYVGTARARLGYAVGDVLPYITGGFAFGSFDAQHNPVPSATDTTENVTGWTIGAGIDWHISNGWFARADYSYVDFGTTRFGFDGGADVHRVSIDGNVFRISIGKKF